MNYSMKQTVRREYDTREYLKLKYPNLPHEDWDTIELEFDDQLYPFWIVEHKTAKIKEKFIEHDGHKFPDPKEFKILFDQTVDLTNVSTQQEIDNNLNKHTEQDIIKGILPSTRIKITGFDFGIHNLVTFYFGYENFRKEFIELIPGYIFPRHKVKIENMIDLFTSFGLNFGGYDYYSC